MANQTRTSKNMIVARTVGTLFLLATAAYIAGSGLIDSILNRPDYLLHVYPNRTQMTMGVVIKFITAVANVTIGVLLFPILKRHSETIALGYVIARIFDGAGVAASGIGTLALIALSQQTIQAGTQSAAHSLTLGNLIIAGSNLAFLVTMIALSLGAMPFSYLLYRSKLIPRSISALGFIGYAVLFIGSLLELFGLDLSMIHYVPGGLFELILPLWLIVKGFNPSAIASESTKPDIYERRGGLSTA